MMISVAEAQSIILQHVQPLPPELLPLIPAAAGLVLAEDVASDLDMPPYDKALMDGYAVRSADLAAGRAVLQVIEEITAGRTPEREVGPGQASRIMTGAPLPAGADAVVMVERTRPLGPDRIEVEDRPAPEQNLLRRGREMHRGETVLRTGTVLRAPEFGLLAAVGRTAAQVVPLPTLAVLSTGDEVVEPIMDPGPGQIRNSNGPMLMALAGRTASTRYLGIARDRADSLRPLIAEGLRAAVLVLSGGVSAGKLDLVPDALAEAEVTAHFHKVEMRPGKPVFFGTRGRTLVFGLPGNPVSSLVCFELFVRPALRRLRGLADPLPRPIVAILAEDFSFRTNRPTYHPARLDTTRDGWRVRPVAWFGSADLRGLTEANALLLLPPGDQRHPAGQPLDVLPLEPAS